MIKIRVQDKLIVGIDANNLAMLQTDNPLVIGLDDVVDAGNLSQVVITYRPTLRELVTEFVNLGLLPQEILNEWRDPQPGEVRKMSQ